MRYILRTGLALLFAATIASAPAMARDHGKYKDRDHGRYSYQDRGDRGHGRRDYDKHYKHRDHGYRYDDRRYRPAPPRVVYRPAYRAPRWSRGHRYDYRGYGPTYVVNNYHGYGLRAPPRGHYWRRSDVGDFLLVAAATGIITDLILHR